MNSRNVLTNQNIDQNIVVGIQKKYLTYVVQGMAWKSSSSSMSAMIKIIICVKKKTFQDINKLSSAHFGTVNRRMLNLIKNIDRFV